MLKRMYSFLFALAIDFDQFFFVKALGYYNIYISIT